MVATSIAALIVFILFMAYLGWLFLFDILELVINGAIIYALFLRSWVEIAREEKYYFYLGGAAAALVVYYFSRNFLEGIYFWGITTYIVLSFVFAQIGMLGHYVYVRYLKKKK